MTPLEVAAKTLLAHGRVASRGIRAVCACGWTSPDPRSGEAYGLSLTALHAAHVADMLAAAGVVPTVQEWGVRRRGSFTIPYNDEDAARDLAYKNNQYYSTSDFHVVSCWTGSTPWVESGG